MSDPRGQHYDQSSSYNGGYQNYNQGYAPASPYPQEYGNTHTSPQQEYGTYDGYQQHTQYAAPAPQVEDPLLTTEKYYYENDRTVLNNWQDFFFVILFYAQLLAGLSFHIYAIITAFGQDSTSWIHTYNISGNTLLYGLAIAVGCISVAFALFFAMRRFKGRVISASLTIIIAFMIFNAIFLATTTLEGSSLPFLGIFAAMSFFIFIYYCCYRSHIPFTEEMISISTDVLDSNKSVFAYGLFITLFQGIFSAVTFLGVLCAATFFYDYTQDVIEGGYYGYTVLALFHLYWINQTASYVFFVTVSGTIGTWWYQPQIADSSKGSFKRAMTTSFGSIAFASFLLTVVRICRMLSSDFLNRQSKGDCNPLIYCVVLCLYCIVTCIENCIRFINDYALVQVALYGKSFLESTRATFSLIENSGFSSIISYDLTGFVIFAGVLSTGTFCGVITAIIVFANQASSETNPVGIGFVVFAVMFGFFVASIIFSTLRASNLTTYIVWAEDPASMEANRPEQFLNLVDAKSKGSFL